MTQYYFDVIGENDVNIDDVGIDLPNIDAARSAALELVPDLGSQIIPERKSSVFTVRVRNAEWTVLMTAVVVLTF